jgi:hypothetical protein
MIQYVQKTVDAGETDDAGPGIDARHGACAWNPDLQLAERKLQKADGD